MLACIVSACLASDYHENYKYGNQAKKYLENKTYYTIAIACHFYIHNIEGARGFAVQCIIVYRSETGTCIW